jgi:ferritin-like metal-binding protein YciE
MVETIRKEFKIMKKLKDLLKESFVWERKFGEKLPTLASIQEKKKLKEVGAAVDYRKITKQIEKSYRKYWDDVKDLEKIMIKKGLKVKAKQIHKEYAKKVLGFQVYLRGIIDRLL